MSKPSSGTNPTTITVTIAPGSIAPSWQSSSPPVSDPMIAQLPTVELTSVYVKFTGGVSSTRTGLAVAPPTLRTSMVNVIGSNPRIRPPEAVFVTVRSAIEGVGVIVGVDVSVDVAVAVVVGVSVGTVASGVAVMVGVLVIVGVSVGVAVFVTVGVVVGVSLGSGVAPITFVVVVAELFASFDSTTMLFGSIVAVLLMTMSVGDVIRPVMTIVATALGPVPNAPRSQSSVPPTGPPSSAQAPRVVVKPRYWKLASGSSMTRTDGTSRAPIFLAWIV